MRKIKNFDELATSETRKLALEMAEAGLQAIDTEHVVKSAVRMEPDGISVKGEKFSLDGEKGIFVVGVGKCSTEAASVLEKILGDRLLGGAVIDVKIERKLEKIRAYKGTHPMPSEENVKAAEDITKLLDGLDEKDFVIFIISGGGSTLLCFPESKSCTEESSVLEALTRAGATIQEINTVRKHLSLARGGYLAKYAYPARSVSLIFSDVPGNDIEFIASGPTVKDNTTIAEAEAVLAKYDVLKACGLEKCGLMETPKDNKYFEKVKNFLAVSNHDALAAMEEKARELGFKPEICDEKMKGEARDVGIDAVKKLHPASPGSVFLYGGETTVTVRGNGRGGRNLELAMSALREVRDGELLMSVASDGHDNGLFAGAICDKITNEAVSAKKADLNGALEENNAYPFFEEIGNYLMTGDTGSNVSDLLITIKNK